MNSPRVRASRRNGRGRRTHRPRSRTCTHTRGRLSMHRLWMRASVLALAVAVILAVFHAVARPWYGQWGATGAEAHMTLPGDETDPSAIAATTPALTIDALAATVSTWAQQIGQDRGGS